MDSPTTYFISILSFKTVFYNDTEFYQPNHFLNLYINNKMSSSNPPTTSKKFSTPK
jgi:hypothetical protein